MMKNITLGEFSQVIFLRRSSYSFLRRCLTAAKTEMSPEMSLRCARVEKELQKMRVAFFHERHLMESSTFLDLLKIVFKNQKIPNPLIVIGNISIYGYIWYPPPKVYLWKVDGGCHINK